MSTHEMADHAGQVIIGTVESIESRYAQDGHAIESMVAFRDVAYLKGKLPQSDDTFELPVPGGTIGRKRMRICCAPDFKPGQRWMLFLLPEYKTFPVVGLYQGAFLIRKDDTGKQRVFRARHEAVTPITGIDGDDYVRVAPPSSEVKFSDCVVRTDGLSVKSIETANESAPPAVELNAFITQLQPILNASKQYNLNEPAGKPLRIERANVPMRAAPAATPANTEATPPALRGQGNAERINGDQPQRQSGGSQ